MNVLMLSSIIVLGLLWKAAAYKNVLFISVDDLRPELGPFIDPMSSPPLFPGIFTPNIDALAAKSLVLKRAFVQEPVCAPSRASILTGRRPDTTCVHGFHHNFREKGGNFTTIPQFFKENGYRTIGMGKIFHDGTEEWHDDPLSWSEPHFRARPVYESLKYSWNSIPDEDLEQPLRDQQLGDLAVEKIKDLADNDEPFFLAVGFYKPHLPFVFPSSVMNYYSNDVVASMALPSHVHASSNMPPIAWSDYKYLRKFHDIQALNITGTFNTTLPHWKTLDLRRAYYACVTYVDYQIGRILTELSNYEAVNDTIVVIWSDNGYHLGENGEWAKFTSFELSNWVPLMIHIPGLTNNGIDSYQLVEMVDLFPTVIEAAGFDHPGMCPMKSQNMKLCTEGMSIMPLIQKPNVPLRSAVFSQVARSRSMGYSIRTERYRYTEYIDFTFTQCKPDWNVVKAAELYDHMRDPLEHVNIAGESSMADVVRQLSTKLRFGWRNAVFT